MEELISGVLVVDKEAGMTSHDVVNRVRRLYGTRQVGHTGTLDPQATGVLVLLVGRAVKASEYLQTHDKTYEALLKLGVETDTEDMTGRVLSTCADLPRAEEVKEVCQRFVGETDQVPPMYSALKQNGRKLVDLARQGVEVERAARRITVYRLTCAPENEREGLYRLTVGCSGGTYIRSLCRDIGRALGCGGAMAALRRTQSGAFTLKGARSLRELEELTDAQRKELLLPVERLFEDLPKVELPPFYRRLCSSGCPVFLKKIGVDLPVGQTVRLSDGERFFALGRVAEEEDGKTVRAVKQFLLYREDGKPC